MTREMLSLQYKMNKGKMEKIKELIEMFLVEKNVVPKIPEEYRDRIIRQKGFKEFRVADFQCP